MWPSSRLPWRPLAADRREPQEPPVATPTVTLNHNRAPAGSPIEITYKFVVANDAKFAEDYRVFAHVVDTDEERMWDDDHDPPTPTSQWKPGQTIEYTRTIFVPIFPYVGDATFQVGLHSLKDQRRLALDAEDVGQRAYRVARFQLLPQTENLFTVWKDGWHPAEVAQVSGTVEWQWTKKEATLAFKNPKKDAVLYLDVDSPSPALHGDQVVQLMMGGQVVDAVHAHTDRSAVQEDQAACGADGNGRHGRAADRRGQDVHSGAGQRRRAARIPRELGVRVFHAFVDPR